MSKRNLNQEQNFTKPARRPPAMTPEEREARLIALATDEAEYQLRNHTASSQVIVHYLKLATVKEQREREKAEEEIKLLRAKTEALEQEKKASIDYAKAASSYRVYAGYADEDSYIIDEGG